MSPTPPSLQPHAAPPLKRSRYLAQMALLIAAGCWFMLLFLLKLFPDYAWLLHILILGAEAGVVGGLADWYAITVLFRNPFGKLPLPRLLREHTEIIPRNKARIAQSMGRFVQENFLSPLVVRQSLQRTDITLMAGHWLAKQEHAAVITGLVQQTAPRILDFLEQQAISEFMQQNMVQWAKNTQMHQLSSELIRAVLDNDFHEDVLQRGLDAAHGWVKTNPDKARALASRLFDELGVATLAWGAGLIGIDVQKRIINAFIGKVEQILQDPQHPMRLHLEQRAQQLMEDLQNPDSAAAIQLNDTKNALLDSPAVLNFLTGALVILRDAVKRDLQQPHSAIAHNLQAALIRLGQNLITSQPVRLTFNAELEKLAVVFSTQYADRIIRYVSERIHEWDSREMIDKIESEVGGDLHMIRVNGVVVGAFIGLVLGIIRALVEQI